MKSYIKKSLFVAGLGAILATTSCSESFLDEEVYSTLTPQSLTNKLGFEAALVGLYQMESTFYTQSNDQGYLCLWQAGTDITWPVQPQGIERPYYHYNELEPNDNGARITWSLYYNIIENANSIIKSVSSTDVADMTEEEELSVEGEAKFFRALAYNKLATLYGGVPLITEPVTTPRVDFVRATLAEVNALIEADLTFATTNLPAPGQIAGRKEGRIHKYTAHHLFAEFYLRANQPALAEAQADAVISSGSFNLVNARYGVKAQQPGDPFSDMFFRGNQRRSQGNTETLWTLENENPADVRGGSTGNPQQRRVWGAAYHNVNGMLPADSLGGRGIARMRLNNWVIYNLYDNTDMRNSKYSIHRRFYYNNPAPQFAAIYGQQVPYTGSDTLVNIPPYTLKWGQYDSRDVFGFGMWKDFILMRLGETYMFKAEAQFKQGNLAGAATTINVLRTRANAPQVSASDITLDFILDERVRELLAEENRRMTLMRTGTLVQRAAMHNPEPQAQIQGLTNTHLLFPIPLSEIQLNTGAVLEQNPGYEN